MNIKSKYIFRVIKDGEHFEVQYNKRLFLFFRLGWERVNTHNTLKSAVECVNYCYDHWNKDVCKVLYERR